MRHAREDYNRIQDPAGLIPDEEPVFLIRAKDICALPALGAWARAAETVGASPEIIEKARNHMMLIHDWQIYHGVKVPDLPTEVA